MFVQGVDTNMGRDNHDDDLDTLPLPEDISEAILLDVTQHPRAYTPVFDVYRLENPVGDEQVPWKK